MIYPGANTKTALYCIFGNPVTHSKSPVMHNALFNENKINAVYLAFNIGNIKTGIDAVREFNIKGVSITIPFKEKVIQHPIQGHARQESALNGAADVKLFSFRQFLLHQPGHLFKRSETSYLESRSGLVRAGSTSTTGTRR